MDDWLVPDLNRAACTRCGLCVDYCPTKAVEMVDGAPVIVRPGDCAYCGQCEEMCPANAIALSYEIRPPATPRPKD
ncbi:MAG TPA: 4Fe-4S binding protein [Aggregatilinea sp.]|jgi:formate hydrogenlyase subunit 6/NADH:ubiquinone oxidoreductase subunit I|uniref:ATP-binding protein n=1 Tax=Aggregatilinea sp. TaxID=2806333 RepID=UPI002B544C55|nr:4Fe-4S binding protein [Aggregatilinea sp.]HML21374.1 4Fe-4S binding protein [Aggregatilinea sp.]